MKKFKGIILLAAFILFALFLLAAFGWKAAAIIMVLMFLQTSYYDGTNNKNS